MNPVTLALESINERLAAFAPQHEGLRDFARLNLQPPTLAIVNESIALYDKRLAALNTAKAALEALVNDGHPELPVREIPLTELTDLRDNAKTIEAALSTFASNAATTLALNARQAEPKK